MVEKQAILFIAFTHYVMRREIVSIDVFTILFGKFVVTESVRQVYEAEQFDSQKRFCGQTVKSPEVKVIEAGLCDVM